MYGPSSGSASSSPPAGGRANGRRHFTPRGSMAGADKMKQALADLQGDMRMMFEPRPMAEFAPPEPPKKLPKYTGIAAYLKEFEPLEQVPPKQPFEPPFVRKKRLTEMRDKLHLEKQELLVGEWDPHANPKATSDAYNTLFVGHLSYDTSERKLRNEFGQYGPIKSLRLVTDKDGKSRGYAFIEYEREEDLKTAFKRACDRKLDGRRLIVDVERGRTVRNWRPARLGGGKGGRPLTISKKQREEEEIRRILAEGSRSIYGDGGEEEDSAGKDEKRWIISVLKGGSKDGGGWGKGGKSGGGGERGGGDERDRERGDRERGRERERDDRGRGDRGGERGGGGDRGGERGGGEGRRYEERGRGDDRRGGERGGDRGGGYSNSPPPSSYSSPYGPSSPSPYGPASSSYSSSSVYGGGREREGYGGREDRDRKRRSRSR